MIRPLTYRDRLAAQDRFLRQAFRGEGWLGYAIAAVLSIAGLGVIVYLSLKGPI